MGADMRACWQAGGWTICAVGGARQELVGVWGTEAQDGKCRRGCMSKAA